MIEEAYLNVRSRHKNVNIFVADDPKHEKKIAKVRDAITGELDDDEKILFTGSRYNLLVTDRYVYTSTVGKIPLENLFVVSFSKMSLGRFLGHSGNEVSMMINGLVILEGGFAYIPRKFLTEALEAIGRARREELGLVGTNTPPGNDDDLELIAAAGVMAKRSPDDLQLVLQAAGAQKDPNDMLWFMTQERDRKDRKGGLLMILAGALLIGVALGVVWLMAKAGATFVVVLNGVAMLGAVIVLSGIWKTITGKRGLEEADIVNLWRVHTGRSQTHGFGPRQE